MRQPGEHVKEHEIHFKLHPAELPLKEEVMTQFSQLKMSPTLWNVLVTSWVQIRKF